MRRLIPLTGKMAARNYKVLVNTSTLMQGGGLQVATAFIEHALKDPDASEWQYMISRTAAEELAGFGIDVGADNFHVFEKSPARILAYGLLGGVRSTRTESLNGPTQLLPESQILA